MCPTVNLVTPWLFGVSGFAAFGDIAVLGGCELHQISSNNGRDGFVFQQNWLNLVTKHESPFPSKKKKRNWFLPWDHQKEKLFWLQALPRRQPMPPRKPTAMRSRPKPMRLGNIWRRWSMTGWWFGTFFIFPYIGNNHPNWLIFFRGFETTNQMRSINPKMEMFSMKILGMNWVHHQIWGSNQEKWGVLWCGFGKRNCRFCHNVCLWLPAKWWQGHG